MGSGLAFHAWRPPPAAPAPWAAIALVHGLGSHGGCFAPLAEALTAAGLVVAAVDLPGHGRSPGARGGLRHWRQFDAAVAELLQRTAAAAPGLPLVLLGHSLGGALTLDYAQRHPGGLAAVVVANPALGLPPSWRLRLTPLLAAVWPGFTVANGIAIEATAHDSHVWQSIRRDPLRHDRASAGLAAGLLRAQRRLLAGTPAFPLPLLILLSSADTVVNPAVTRRYAAAIGPGAVTLLAYDHSLHELLDDQERQRVRADLLAWLRARFAPPPSALQGRPQRG